MVALGTNATLAQLYARLTSDSQSAAWPKFQAAVKALPNIVNDDPFGAGSSGAKKLLSKAGTRSRRAS
jgi:hypothetical protein